MRKIAILSLLVFLNACGTAPAWLATSTGSYSQYKVTSLVKTGADIALSAAELPTTTDFALSNVSCLSKSSISKFFNFISFIGF